MTRTVVIGAGVVGLACARALRQRGEEVVVVDARTAGGGCSRGNAGWVVPCFSTPLPAPGLTLTSLRWMARRDSPLYIAPRAIPSLATWLWRFRRHCNARDYAAGVRALALLNRDTLGAYRELAAGGSALGTDFELREDGVLFAFLDPRAAAAAMRDLELIGRYGYPVPELLDGDEARRLEPALSRRVAAAALVKHDAQLRPESLVDGLALALERDGVEMRLGEQVTAVVRRGNAVKTLRTARGEIAGDRFVVAAGAWSGALCAQLGTHLPVQAGKGYSLTMPARRRPLQRALYLADAHVACTPFEGALRVAGTMELSGHNERLDRARVDSIRRASTAYFVEPPDWGEARAWVGMRPITPDGLPIIGWLPGVDNVFVATGHAMLGVTLAPATAKLVVAHMLDGGSDLDITPFAPSRFVRS